MGPKTRIICFFVAFFSQFFELSVCQYQIPSYYGHWSKDFYKASKIQSGSFTVFQIHFALDLDYSGQTVYFADKFQHSIFSYVLSSKDSTELSGKPGKMGSRVGNLKSSYYYEPSSVAYWKFNSERHQTALSSETFVVKNESCSLSSEDCLYTDLELETLESGLSLQNIRISPFPELFPVSSDSETEFLYIADKANHCIKKINLSTSSVEVVAGICGTSGFLDGPLGFNRLNSPTNLGIDSKGVVYFYDEANEYMRKITEDLTVATLLNGACTEYTREGESNRMVNGFELKKLICYEDWIEKKTTSAVQHYFDEDLLNICQLHSSKCASEL